MEKTTLGLIAGAIIIAALAGLWFKSDSAGNGNHKGMTPIPLPSVLDQYYPSGGPPVLLLKMLDMVDSFTDISINLQENDTVNAKNSFHKFSSEYDNVSKMVPEWSGYFDKSLVANIGSDIDAGNVFMAFNDIGRLVETCDNCHRDIRPQVWAKYYWKDFAVVNVTTINPNEPVAPWKAAMAKYLAPSFEGMITNLKEGKRDAANQSFENFRTMLLNFKNACSDCHNIEPKYFVSDDIMAMVNQTGDYVQSGNITGVEQNVQIIGMESCYKCHVLHQPAQMMKDIMNQ